MTTPIYHVGLVARGHTAVFQYRKSVDNLSCEILHYYGTRQTTKKVVRAVLKATKAETLTTLNTLYPDKGFTRVIID